MEPHGGKRNRRNDIRQVDHGPEKAFAPDAGGDDDGEEKGKRQDDQAAEEPDAKEIPHGNAEQGRMKELGVIGKPYKLPFGDPVGDAFDFEKTHGKRA